MIVNKLNNVGSTSEIWNERNEDGANLSRSQNPNFTTSNLLDPKKISLSRIFTPNLRLHPFTFPTWIKSLQTSIISRSRNLFTTKNQSTPHPKDQVC